MSVISLSEVAFKRFEVDSLVDSAQTWHVDTPRASGVWVPANFPQTAISLGISHSVSTRPMSCLDTVRSTKSNGEQCTTSDRRGRHRKRKCSSSACSLQKFATDIHGWTAVYNIGSSASLRAQAQVRLGNPESGWMPTSPQNNFGLPKGVLNFGFRIVNFGLPKGVLNFGFRIVNFGLPKLPKI